MKIILFDGVCNLCNSIVQFIIKHDINDEFKFSSLQSEYGKSFLKAKKLNEIDYDTIILIEDNVFYERSNAILRIGIGLPRYRWVKILLKIPRPIRDVTYKLISKYRYVLLGKNKKNCMMPTPKSKEKFLF